MYVQHYLGGILPRPVLTNIVPAGRALSTHTHSAAIAGVRRVQSSNSAEKEPPAAAAHVGRAEMKRRLYQEKVLQQQTATSISTINENPIDPWVPCRFVFLDREAIATVGSNQQRSEAMDPFRSASSGRQPPD